MADLTASEQAKVRRLLGYQHNDNAIDPFMVGLSAEAYAEVQAILTSITALETALDSAATTMGPYKRVEDVEFNGAAGIAVLQDRLNQRIRQLSYALGAAMAEGTTASGGSVSTHRIWRV